MLKMPTRYRYLAIVCMMEARRQKPISRRSLRETELDASSGIDMTIFCIDRHQGGINMTFMDESVRKVGSRNYGGSNGTVVLIQACIIPHLLAAMDARVQDYPPFDFQPVETRGPCVNRSFLRYSQ